MVALALIAGITIWLKRVIESYDDESFQEDFSDLKIVPTGADADSTGSDQSQHVIKMYDDEDYARDRRADSVDTEISMAMF